MKRDLFERLLRSLIFTVVLEYGTDVFGYRSHFLRRRKAEPREQINARWLSAHCLSLIVVALVHYQASALRCYLVW